ncbi:MAG: type III pantothenate kinase [Nitrospirae bacterium]|nr:type III pantothenate kinase [Nitrospirota bacterium]
MLLAVDIGNSQITLGVYQGEDLRCHGRLSTRAEAGADEYGILLRGILATHGADLEAVDAVILSCVVPALQTVFEEVARNFLHLKPTVVGPHLQTGLTLRIDRPEELGADRLVNAVAAYHRYGGPVILVDLGTATTFCVVSADGEYLGGAIAAGLEITADALFQRTAKLPRVSLDRPPRAVGTNTVHAMQAGLLLGHAAMIEGLIRRIKTELQDSPRVIATGGLAERLAPEIEGIDEVRPFLTLEGLKLLYDMNA